MKKTVLTVLVVLLALTCAFAQAVKEEATVETLDLVIYSAGKEEEAIAVCDKFNELHKDVQLNYTILQIDSSSVITRVNTEWPKPEGDVIFLLGSENLDQIVDKLASYKNVNDADFAAEYKNPEYKYYAVSMPLQAIMYNTDILSEKDAPKSWKDLADPKYYGMIELANPATSGSAYAQLYQMYCLYGMDFAKAVADNGTVYVSSSSKGPTDVSRGEFAITVTGEANVVEKLQNGDPVAYVHPAEGTGLRTEGCAILANCKNERAAKLFMDFVTSVEGETVLASLGRRPALASAPTPDFIPALADMKFYEYNNNEAKSLKKQLQAEFSTFI